MKVRRKGAPAGEKSLQAEADALRDQQEHFMVHGRPAWSWVPTPEYLEAVKQFPGLAAALGQGSMPVVVDLKETT